MSALAEHNGTNASDKREKRKVILICEVERMWSCPVCGERGIGKVGIGQYYCKDCCVEFEYKNNRLKVYHVEDDGTLSQYTAANTPDVQAV